MVHVSQDDLGCSGLQEGPGFQHPGWAMLPASTRCPASSIYCRRGTAGVARPPASRRRGHASSIHEVPSLQHPGGALPPASRRSTASSLQERHCLQPPGEALPPASMRGPGLQPPGEALPPVSMRGPGLQPPASRRGQLSTCRILSGL